MARRSGRVRTVRPLQLRVFGRRIGITPRQIAGTAVGAIAGGAVAGSGGRIAGAVIGAMATSSRR
jgi:hypothetical protein